MDIGIGIPNTVPGVSGELLLQWARRAEDAGFSSLASIGAVSYPSYEELTVFAAAGAVTERIGFISNVLIAPARSAAELAKQAATVDQLTGGRLTLGMGVGWRDADYALTGRSFDDRGARFDQMLREMRRAWQGEAIAEGTRPVAPPTTRGNGMPMLIGGSGEQAFRRAAEHGIGWTAGGATPEQVGSMAEQARAAWRDAGRGGEPRIVALAYYGLGDTEEESRQALMDYYQPGGDEYAKTVADSALRSPDTIRQAVEGFADAGVDELILDPTVADVRQVDLLAEVVR